MWIVDAYWAFVTNVVLIFAYTVLLECALVAILVAMLLLLKLIMMFVIPLFEDFDRDMEALQRSFQKLQGPEKPLQAPNETLQAPNETLQDSVPRNIPIHSNKTELKLDDFKCMVDYAQRKRKKREAQAEKVKDGELIDFEEFTNLCIDNFEEIERLVSKRRGYENRSESRKC